MWVLETPTRKGYLPVTPSKGPSGMLLTPRPPRKGDCSPPRQTTLIGEWILTQQHVFGVDYAYPPQRASDVFEVWGHLKRSVDERIWNDATQEVEDYFSNSTATNLTFFNI